MTDTMTMTATTKTPKTEAPKEAAQAKALGELKEKYEDARDALANLQEEAAGINAQFDAAAADGDVDRLTQLQARVDTLPFEGHKARLIMNRAWLAVLNVQLEEAEREHRDYGQQFQKVDEEFQAAKQKHQAAQNLMLGARSNVLSQRAEIAQAKLQMERDTAAMKSPGAVMRWRGPIRLNI